MTGVYYCPHCGTDQVHYTKNGVRCAKCGRRAIPAQKQTASKHSQLQVGFNKESKMIQVKRFPVKCPHCQHTIQFSMDFNIPPEIQQDLYKYQIYLETLLGIGLPFDWEEFHCSPDQEHKKAFDTFRFWAEERLRDTPREFLMKGFA